MAGTLKLDLAQFRELEAFATFGSELDAVSKAQLERGYRLVELLKQPLNSPDARRGAGGGDLRRHQGYLDDVPVGDVRRFESELLDYLRARARRAARRDPQRRSPARRRSATLSTPFKAQFQRTGQGGSADPTATDAAEVGAGRVPEDAGRRSSCMAGGQERILRGRSAASRRRRRSRARWS